MAELFIRGGGRGGSFDCYISCRAVTFSGVGTVFHHVFVVLRTTIRMNGSIAFVLVAGIETVVYYVLLSKTR